MSVLVPGKLRRNVEYRETISWNKFQDGFPNLCIQDVHYMAGKDGKKMSRLVEKPTMWFPTRSDTNQSVLLQKRARILKFRI